MTLKTNNATLALPWPLPNFRPSFMSPERPLSTTAAGGGMAQRGDFQTGSFDT
jgi:hypothetical protein